jgi:hypothetical protein
MDHAAVPGRCSPLMNVVVITFVAGKTLDIRFEKVREMIPAVREIPKPRFRVLVGCSLSFSGCLLG